MTISRSFARFLLALAALVAAPPALSAAEQFVGLEESLDIEEPSLKREANFGDAISRIGDVNDDGADDLIVAAPYASTAAGRESGAVFLYSGRAKWDFVSGYWTHELILRIDGNEAYAHLGTSVSGLPDLDNDQVDDFAVSSPGADHLTNGLPDVGSLKIYSGATLQVIHTIYGVASGDTPGSASVVAVGDWGGTVGNKQHLALDYGYGNSSDDSVRILEWDAVDVSAYFVELVPPSGSGNNRFGDTLDVEEVGSGGTSVLLVGAPWWTGGLTLQGGVFECSISTPGQALTATVQEVSRGAAPSDFYGASVAYLGDGNGDGLSEIIVGIAGDDGGGTNAGKIEILEGATYGLIADYLGQTVNGRLGAEVSPAGDLDGDLLPDAIAAAPFASSGGLTENGRVHLLGVDYTGMSVSTLASVDGPGSYSQLGWDVSALTDDDGDGASDLAIGQVPGALGPVQPAVKVLRPRHSYPYRITVDASSSSSQFAPIHGTNGGPTRDSGWTISHPAIGTILTVEDSDYTDAFTRAFLPHARAHIEGGDDLNILWTEAQTNQSRDYTGILATLNNSSNYDFLHLDQWVEGVHDLAPAAEIIMRLGHTSSTEAGPALSQFMGPPNSNSGIAVVVRNIVSHLHDAFAVGFGHGYQNEPGYIRPVTHFEIWNEPFFENFWEADPVTGEVDPLEYADMHGAILDELAVYDTGGDGWPDGMTVITPIQVEASDEISSWTEQMLDRLLLNGDSIRDLALHSYVGYPYRMVQQLERIDDMFSGPTGYASSSKFDISMPSVWITEWNRENPATAWARDFWDTPFIWSVFYHLNGIEAGDYFKSNGDPFSISIGGANCYGISRAWSWIPGVGSNPGTLVTKNVGKVFEIYGDYLANRTPNRLLVDGPFVEIPEQAKYGGGTFPGVDFVALAGADQLPSPQRVHVVISTVVQDLLTISPTELRNSLSTITSPEPPVVLTITDLPSVPSSVRRLVPGSNAGTGPNPAIWVEIPLGGMTIAGAGPPYDAPNRDYEAWTATPSPVGPPYTLVVNLPNTFENSWEFFEILL